jgi:hypothetical protein
MVVCETKRRIEEWEGAGTERINGRKSEKKRKKEKWESGRVRGKRGREMEEREGEWDTCPIVGGWEKMMLSSPN